MDFGERERAERAPAPARLELEDSLLEELPRLDPRRDEYLIRLEMDRSIIEELRAAGFRGIHYGYFETALTKYGVAVLTAWIQTHQIFIKMRQRGMGGLPDPRDEQLREHDTAQELAMETVARALKNFREYVLVGNRWDAEKGASLRTYFIGQCLIQFANVYRRWHRETYDHAPWGFLVNEAVQNAWGYEHVEEVVQVQARVEVALNQVRKDRTKEVLVLHAAGHTHDEIAGRLGTTVKTIEMTIRNERIRQMRSTTT